MMNLDFKKDFSKREIIDTLKEVRHPFEIAIWDSKNGFNIGGSIRSAHAFLANQIHIIESSGWYKKGAITTLKYERENIRNWDSIDNFIKHVRGRNVVAFERRESLETKDIRRFIYPDNPILLFGSENEGVPDKLLEISCDVVSIGIYGLINDLNLAVAASIAMHDWTTKYYRGKRQTEIW